MTSATASGPHITRWTPQLGAWPDADGFRFKVWTPGRDSVKLQLATRRVTLDSTGDGTFTTTVAGLEPGTRYGYVLDDGTALPDPASRYQPDGVHALSATVDPRAFI
ncbi:MAG: hypothetical protein HQ485_05230 [Acidobacteria bacterium]|nr:hypothetical protein [Acidobacteriota bacterium]